MTEKMAIAERLGIPTYHQINEFPLVRDRIPIIPYLFAKQKKILPLEDTGESIIVAICEPLDLNSLENSSLILDF